MEWDLDADVVCTGFGAAGLATAISVVDLGGDVFVASSINGTPGPSVEPFAVHPDRLHPWLPADVSDTETSDYLAALWSDLGPARRSVRDVDVPICVVRERPAEAGRTIAPFVGARLRDWTAHCLTSPYGFLHTRVRDWGTTTLHTIEGEVIEVAEIGSISPDFDNVSGSVVDWVAAQARDRNIEIQADCSLQRIVFKEGNAIGAVFSTPDGPLAVQARHGVTVATGSPRINATPQRFRSGGALVGADLKVCVVSRHASRFGRLELLTSEESLTHNPSTRQACSRQVQANLRETRGQSPVGRCAVGEGYPTAGQ